MGVVGWLGVKTRPGWSSDVVTGPDKITVVTGFARVSYENRWLITIIMDVQSGEWRLAQQEGLHREQEQHDTNLDPSIHLAK